MQTVLTIAGFDPSSGAGVTADLAVFAAHGLFGTAATTALTVQTTTGVRLVHPVDAGVLRETLAALEDDLPPAGIKIGMLGTAPCVLAVAELIESLHRRGRKPVVVLDPVLQSSSGRSLLEPDGVNLLRERLLPMVQVATPNVEELCVLGNFAGLSGPTEIIAAAIEFQTRYSSLSLVVTGGDLEPPDDLLLVHPNMQPDRTPHWLPGERVKTTSTHGTGCAFSSALLSHLVLGDHPDVAALAAKQYVAGALRAATPRGHGRGPMDLFWNFRRDEQGASSTDLWTVIRKPE